MKDITKFYEDQLERFKREFEAFRRASKFFLASATLGVVACILVIIGAVGDFMTTSYLIVTLCIYFACVVLALIGLFVRGKF